MKRKFLTNSLSVVKPELAKEWHPTKNGSLEPKDVSYGSSVKVWWKCSLGHEWQATIKNRSKGQGCPICKGKKVLKGFNDFGSNYPNLVKEWASDLNKDDPYSVSKYCNKTYYWRCDKGHVWKDSINHRTSRNSKCPICQNKRVLKGYNDFATLFPFLASEWDYGKNNLKPDEITAGSNKKVWWKCPNGHESYLQYINRRTKGAGCPICNSIFQTSFPEQAIFFYIKKLFPDAKKQM